jgi:predicted Rossmann-fold nucleotide-binding protein
MVQKKSDCRMNEIRTRDAFDAAHGKLRWTAAKGLDLSNVGLAGWKRAAIEQTYFLGCAFKNRAVVDYLLDRGAVLLTRFPATAYNPFRAELYTPEELEESVAPRTTRDRAIYKEYLAKGQFSPDVIEALTRRIHDDSIDDALERLVAQKGALKVAGFVGGSAVERGDEWYRKTAETARLVARDGNFVMTGGGPGMMEAANLGAYFSARHFGESDLEAAIDILAAAPEYEHPEWRQRAAEVKERFPRGAASLGVPTWFYGREPTNSFATHVAKYFDNSIREGGLLMLSLAGVVVAPGSAGTLQEIFMDAEQNYYATSGYHSPMVFLGVRQWEMDTPVFSLVKQTANEICRDMLFISDFPAEIAELLAKTKPIKKTQRRASL